MNATMNAGINVITGQMASDNTRIRECFSGATDRAWMFAATARLNAPIAAANDACHAVMRVDSHKRT